MPNKQPKILIAGVGNELRQDDAFGVLLAQKLQQEASLPPSVKVMEIGSAGIHLVQQLFDKYDVLLLLDIVNKVKGTVKLNRQRLRRSKQRLKIFLCWFSTAFCPAELLRF